MRTFLAEFIGTFALVFCGTGAIIVNDLTGGTVTHLGVALTFGLIVTAMIYAFGNVSGAHINPAVSIAFACTEEFAARQLPRYLGAQFLGALFASVVLKFLFWEHETLGATLPGGAGSQTFVLEIILTYLLMLVILFVSHNDAVNQFTGLAVGATVALEALFAGPISGASMNPARSLGPAVVAGELGELWIYLIAPVVGAVGASLTWNLMDEKTT